VRRGERRRQLRLTDPHPNPLPLRGRGDRNVYSRGLRRP
jgi:hypothetical protein